MTKRRQLYRWNQCNPELSQPQVQNNSLSPYRELWNTLLPQIWEQREAYLTDPAHSEDTIPGCVVGTYSTGSRPIEIRKLLRCWQKGLLCPMIDNHPAEDWRLFRFGGSLLSGCCMAWSAFNIRTGEVVDCQDPVELRHNIFPGNVVSHLHAYHSEE